MMIVINMMATDTNMVFLFSFLSCLSSFSVEDQWEKIVVAGNPVEGGAVYIYTDHV